MAEPRNGVEDELKRIRDRAYIVIRFYGKAIAIKTSKLDNVLGALAACVDGLKAGQQ